MKAKFILLALVALLVGLDASDVIAEPPSRGGDAPIITRPLYDYGPTIMREGWRYRMWWCGAPADRIWYSEATDLQGPWSPPIVVFHGTGDPDDFDGTLTADPSVIKVGGIYYMYYTGFPRPQWQHDSEYSRIGVAASPDGIHWYRMNSGRPIVEPSLVDSTPKTYGAGQPSVIFNDGYFMMIHTDSTGAVKDGQYILKSTEPTFQQNVYEYRANGWRQLGQSEKPSGLYSPVAHAQSVDWQYVDALDRYAVAIDGLFGTLSVRFYEPDFSKGPTGLVEITGTWTEGPGLVSTPRGHGLTAGSGSVLKLDVIRSVGGQHPDTWDLAHAGLDIPTGHVLTPSRRYGVRSNDFDGDGKHDLAVVRQTGGELVWFINSSTGVHIVRPWGLAGDIPAASDYDGDGIRDLCVFRPSAGRWFILNLSGEEIRIIDWGLPGDIPVPADYDGDGVTDPAVWRPSDGRFYVTASSGSVPGMNQHYWGFERQWGWTGDVPVPADYDGDGLADLAVWRPSTGVWFIIRSSNQKVVTHQWGITGDVPIPGDYDGDGKLDPAVWRAPQAIHFVLPSTGIAPPGMIPHYHGFMLAYGLTGDLPVPADHDGDGRTDPSVWRPANAVWYVNGRSATQWGLGGDQPVR